EPFRLQDLGHRLPDRIQPVDRSNRTAAVEVEPPGTGRLFDRFSVLRIDASACRDHPPTTLFKIKYFCPPWTRSSTTRSPAWNPGRMTYSTPPMFSTYRVSDSGTIKKSASRVKRWSTFTSSGSARVTVPNITATGAAASTAVRAACRIAFSMSDHLQRDGHRMIGAVEPVRHLVHHHRLVDTERLDDDRQVHTGANPDVADCLQLERALLPVLE